MLGGICGWMRDGGLLGFVGKVCRGWGQRGGSPDISDGNIQAVRHEGLETEFGSHGRI